MKKVIIAGAFALSGCFFGTSCVARGTRVSTPSGPRRIEELQVGDEVFAFDEDARALRPTRITAIKSAQREVGLLSAGDSHLRLTSDHPVYCPVDDLYAAAGDWFLGQRTQLMTCDGPVEVEHVESYVAIAEVFDITVEDELHNFVADGFVVHNKSPVPDCAFGFGDSCECADGTEGTRDCSGNCECADPNNDDQDMSTATDAANNGDPDLGGGDAGTTDLGADMSADTGADAGAPRERGDCVDDSDCARDTWMCVAVGEDEPGAHYTCQADVAAEPGCATIEPPDECCVHADCTDDPSGTCVVGPIFYCGGVAPMIRNICLYDECAADADCGAGQVCMPPRVLGEPVARCVPSECGTDADCDSSAGGECHMFRDPCNRRVSGFFCTYDDSTCRTSDDCVEDPNTPGVEYCAPGPNGDGDTVCASFQPPP